MSIRPLETLFAIKVMDLDFLDFARAIAGSALC